MSDRNRGDYPGRLSLRVRPEDKLRLEEFAYQARRPNGYILMRALDLYEAEQDRSKTGTSSMHEHDDVDEIRISSAQLKPNNESPT